MTAAHRGFYRTKGPSIWDDQRTAIDPTTRGKAVASSPTEGCSLEDIQLAQDLTARALSESPHKHLRT